MNTLTSFQPLLDRCAEFDALKSDTVVDTRSFRFTEGGQAVVPSEYGAAIMGMEDGALGQLGDRLGRYFWQTSKKTIPTEFYRQLYSAWPTHFAGLTNDLLNNMEGKLLIRGYGEDVRAVLSEQYAKLDNAEMLDMAQQVLTGVPFEIVQSGQYYSRNDGVQRDEMTIRVVVKTVRPKDEDGGGYGLGVVIRNGETGGAASEVRPLIMRTSCLNSLIMSRGEDGEKLGLRLTHKGTKESKLVLFAAALQEALPMASEGLKKFLETKRVEIDLNAVIARMGEDEDWSEEMKIAVAIGSEGQENVYGLINGLTFAANQVDLDASHRFDLEALASKFVYQPSLARV